MSGAVHADPGLLLGAPIHFTEAGLTRLAQLRRAHGFRFAGDYYLNYNGLNEKWLQDRAGAWHILTPDGSLYRVRPFWFRNGYLWDVTNPGARDWWLGKRRYLRLW